MKPRSAGITADSWETPSCASSLQEAKQITVDKQEWGVYSEQPMNPNTVQVQDCTHTLTEMYGCVYRRICLVTHPLNSARQLPAQLSVFRHRFAKLQKKGLSQTREGIRLVILDQFPWLTQTRSMLGGGKHRLPAVTGRFSGNTSKSHYSELSSLFSGTRVAPVRSLAWIEIKHRKTLRGSFGPFMSFEDTVI